MIKVLSLLMINKKIVQKFIQLYDEIIYVKISLFAKDF